MYDIKVLKIPSRCTLYSCRRLYKITSCAPCQYNEDRNTVTRSVLLVASHVHSLHLFCVRSNLKICRNNNYWVSFKSQHYISFPKLETYVTKINGKALH